MILAEKLRAWRADGFLSAVGVLVGGTGLAHLILALALPIVTRLYTPADFKLLTVFTSLVAIVAVAACLRFEVAIPIPKHDIFAVNVLALALTFAAIAAALVAIVVALFSTTIAGWLNVPSIVAYLWLVPIGVLLVGGMSALQFWFARKRAYGAIARARIGQSCAVVGTQLGCGWASITPGGLLFAQLLNSGASCLALGYRVWRDDSVLLSSIRLSRMRAMFRAYDRFPKYSTFESLMDAAQSYLPLLMIAALVTGPEAGYLALAMYAVQAPMGLVGRAVSQVYLARAAEEYRAQRLGTFTNHVLGRLLKIGVGPIIFAGLVAPSVFAGIFGAEWRRAGELTLWMTPWFVLQFLSAPLSMALPVTNRQKTSLLLQGFGTIIRVVAVQAAALLTPRFIAETYAVSSFVAYVAYLAVVLHVAAVDKREFLAEIRRALPYMLFWTVSGGLVALGFVLLSMVNRSGS